MEATLPTWTPRICTLASGFITKPARVDNTVTGPVVGAKLPRNMFAANAKTPTITAIVIRPASGRATECGVGAPLTRLLTDRLQPPLTHR